MYVRTRLKSVSRRMPNTKGPRVHSTLYLLEHTNGTVSMDHLKSEITKGTRPDDARRNTLSFFFFYYSLAGGKGDTIYDARNNNRDTRSVMYEPRASREENKSFFRVGM